MLEDEGAPVGVLLLIYSLRDSDAGPAVHCNLSSWYVEPSYRSYAPMLTNLAQRHREVSYFNISPAHWTWPIIETQGFHTYCKGLFFSFPALSRNRRGATVEIVSAGARSVDGLSDADAELLLRHAAYGCTGLVCRTTDGAFPFVFVPPAMQLVYCRDIAEYVACAGAIGRALLRRGLISVLLDANGHVPGLIGFYTETRGRKYCKGPHRPRLADLSDSELVLYGP
jgi:hypothetical protein